MADTNSVEEAVAEISSSLGNIIRKARLSKGISQKELAKRLDSWQYLISIWESGKHPPTIYSLVRIAQALDLELKISFGGEHSAHSE